MERSQRVRRRPVQPRVAHALKLRRGQHGSVSAQAVAKGGGGASEGHWTRTGQQNATFGPDQADGAAPSFSYDVTNAGKDVVVTLGLRVTSKAGVGEGTWQQETDDLALYRGTVTGTYSVSGGCGGSWEWSYSARLADIVGNDQPFPIIDPASGGGPEGGGAAGYDETLTGTITYPPCGSDPGCSSDLSIDYGYGVLLFDADADTVTASMEPPPIKSGCGSLVNTLGEASFPRSMVGADAITLHFPYDDGVTTTSGTLTLTRVN